MTSILVVFPKAEDRKSIRNLLVRHGYDVAAVCTLGSQVLNNIDLMNNGVIVSGYKYPDMYYTELIESLPTGFDMLLLASSRVCAECVHPNVICVAMPLQVQDLMSTLEMMCMNQMRRKKKLRSQPKKRTEEEKQILEKAKAVLMERNHMTDNDALLSLSYDFVA